MTDIFAHRALFDSKMNSLEGISNCVTHDIGLELDLRYGKEGVYMSHDPVESEELFEEACKILKNSNSKVALHIKEINVVKEVMELVYKNSINNNCFVFMDSDNYTTINNLAGKYVEVAFYASEKPKNVPARILWCDELQSKWYSKEIITDLHKQNKIIYSVSKELLEPCSINDAAIEWNRLLKLGFDGICTDYPKELTEFLDVKRRELN